METANSVSWIFKPDSSTSQLAPNYNQRASPGSLNKPSHQSTYTHSPSTSHAYTSPITPRAGSTSHVGSPYRTGSASPHSSAGLPRHQSTPLSQDLLLPMMPSTEESKLHATVSGLRFALQDSQLQLSHAQQQVCKATTICSSSEIYVVLVLHLRLFYQCSPVHDHAC